MNSFIYCVHYIYVWVCLVWLQGQHPVVKRESQGALSVLLTHSHGWCLWTMATTSVGECSSMNSGCSLLPSAGTSKYYTNVKCRVFTTESSLRCSGTIYNCTYFLKIASVNLIVLWHNPELYERYKWPLDHIISYILGSRTSCKSK